MSQNLPLRVAIRCIVQDIKYLVQFEGSDVSATAASVEDAILQAGQLVVEETVFTLYGVDGEALVTGTLFPLATPEGRAGC